MLSEDAKNKRLLTHWLNQWQGRLLRCPGQLNGAIMGKRGFLTSWSIQIQSPALKPSMNKTLVQFLQSARTVPLKPVQKVKIMWVMDEIHIEDKLYKWRAMVSLQRNWFPAMKLNCYNISVSCFTLNRILQSTSTSHHGSKSKTWLRCQHGVFWWCRINVVMRSVGCGWTRHDHQPLSCSWGDQFTNPGPAEDQRHRADE